MTSNIVASLVEAVITASIGQPIGAMQRSNRRSHRRANSDPTNQNREAFGAMVTNWGHSISKIAWQATKAIIAAQILFVISAILYSVIYSFAMPAKLLKAPLFFDYGASIRGKVLPKATVNLLSKQTQWIVAEDFAVSNISSNHALIPDQTYSIFIELLLPLSVANENTGVFMVNTKLYDDKDKFLGSSARPGFLPYTSSLLRSMRIFAFWPFFLSGLATETEFLQISCMDFFEEHVHRPLTKAVIELSSVDVQLYEAFLVISPQLAGIPWLMNQWFYTCSLLGTLMIAVILASSGGFIYLIMTVDNTPNTVEKRQEPLLTSTKRPESDLQQFNEPIRYSSQIVEPFDSSPVVIDDRQDVEEIYSSVHATVTSSDNFMMYEENERILNRENRSSTQLSNITQKFSGKKNWNTTLDNAIQNFERQQGPQTISQPLLVSGSKYDAKSLQNERNKEDNQDS